MPDSRPHLLPGPDHPIAFDRSPAHVVVRRGDVILAESDQAIELREASYPPVYYLPLHDLDMARFRPSDEHTYCPYKGEASYYDIVDAGGDDLAASAWYYPQPHEAVAAIQGHVAFYDDRVSVEAG